MTTETMQAENPAAAAEDEAAAEVPAEPAEAPTATAEAPTAQVQVETFGPETAKMLREAARRGRIVAGSASEGRWVHEVDSGEHRVGTADRRTWVAYTGDTTDEPGSNYDADHIAVWDPIVATAALDLLDSVAADMEISGPDMPGYGWPEAVAFGQAVIEATGGVQ